MYWAMVRGVPAVARPAARGGGPGDRSVDSSYLSEVKLKSRMVE